MMAVFDEAAIPYVRPDGGIFFWMKVPEQFDGETFVTYLLQKLSILATPGIPFGPGGKDYIRISMAVADDVLDEFLGRIKEISSLYH